MSWDVADLYEGSTSNKTQCSASSEFSATYIAENAFDGVTGVDVDDCWISTSANPPANDNSCYLQWDFPQRMLIAGIQIKRRDTAVTGNFPKTIRLIADGEVVEDLSVNSANDGAWSDEIPFTLGIFCDTLKIAILDKWDRGTAEDWVAVKEVRFLGWDEIPDVSLKTADFDGVLTSEVSETENDYGYLGTAHGVYFPLKYREVKGAASSPDYRFGKESNGFKVRDDYGYGFAYVFQSFAASDIDGKYLRMAIVDVSGAAFSYSIRIYDGSYEQSSMTDFVSGTGIATKGAGILETVYSGALNNNTITHLIDLSSATLPDVTIVFSAASGNPAYASEYTISEFAITNVIVDILEGEGAEVGVDTTPGLMEEGYVGVGTEITNIWGPALFPDGFYVGSGFDLFDIQMEILPYQGVETDLSLNIGPYKSPQFSVFKDTDIAAIEYGPLIGGYERNEIDCSLNSEKGEILTGGFYQGRGTPIGFSFEPMIAGYQAKSFDFSISTDSGRILSGQGYKGQEIDLSISADKYKCLNTEFIKAKEIDLSISADKYKGINYPVLRGKEIDFGVSYEQINIIVGNLFKGIGIDCSILLDTGIIATGIEYSSPGILIDIEFGEEDISKNRPYGVPGSTQVLKFYRGF